ncbi:MAG: prephenate dehydrogenase/arogenate dehydrogenase family protein [Nitrososphaerota archaeon]
MSKIAIIGGAGKMGQWLIKYFKDKHEVLISDINIIKAKEIAKKNKIKYFENNLSLVKNANIVLLSIPISEMVNVLKDIENHLKKDCILIEIASIKAPFYDHLKNFPRKDVTCISLHPLFGPRKKRFKKMNIIIIPIKNLEKELGIAKKIFPEASFINLNIEEHDKAMAIILSLIHFINLSLGLTLKDIPIKNIIKYAGPSFLKQYSLLRKILNESPNAYADIQFYNKYNIEIINKFIEKTIFLKNLINNKDKEIFISLFNELINSFSEKS